MGSCNAFHSRGNRLWAATVKNTHASPQLVGSGSPARTPEGPLIGSLRRVAGLQLGALFHALLASFAFNAIWIGVNLLLGWSLGIEAGLFHYLVFVPLVSLSLLLPSVGGLGVREMTYVGLFGLVGVAEEKAFALGILVYAIHIVTGLIGGIIYLIQGARS